MAPMGRLALKRVIHRFCLSFTGKGNLAVALHLAETKDQMRGEGRCRDAEKPCPNP